MRHILYGDRSAVVKAVLEAPDGHYVEIKQSTRTSDQNKLYWAELQTLADKCGHTAPLWHEYMKQMFLPTDAVEINGVVVVPSKSTTKLSKQEFSDYIETVFAWIATNVK